MSNKVITWSAPDGSKINLTRAQIKLLRKWDNWPRSAGQQYCQVSHGLHYGTPSFTDTELAKRFNDHE